MTEVTTNVRETPAKVTFRPGEGVQERWMDFDGARMRYLQSGSGPALILLHGLLGYSFSWRYAMPALAPYATVYAPDLLGAGFSDRPRIDHSMRATALSVLRFAGNLGLGSFDLLGTSRGGAVAMCVAAICHGWPVQTTAAQRMPTAVTSAPVTSTTAERLSTGGLRVRRLVLVAPVNPYSPHGRWLAPAAGSHVGSVLVRAVLECMPSLYPYWHARMFGDRKRIPAGSLEGYTAPLAKPGLFDHALSIVSTWTADLRDLEALLPTLVSIPTLLMWGSKDPAVYFSSMKPLARHFSSVEMMVFPGVGHLPYEECPEEFNRALIKFLRGNLLEDHLMEDHSSADHGEFRGGTV